MAEDISYIKVCKKENLLPTFAKIRLSINNNNKLRKKLTRTIMEAELQNKHVEKRKLKREIIKLCNQLKEKCWLYFI